ncbi:major facilitator superfamily transporter [Diaporthe helianthi]|uniref:Major facilitator superfamily transporter n=1 Tax=Diaporthe helianthi TaxID=158607 RepID=A0A2P5I223_DIAHE|nr:major facilitator superfamily transporter [Diaporthe helianthi]
MPWLMPVAAVLVALDQTIIAPALGAITGEQDDGSYFSLDSPFGDWFGHHVLAGLGISVGFQLGIVVVQAVLAQ